MRSEEFTHHIQNVAIWVLVIVLGAMAFLSVRGARRAARILDERLGS